MLTKNEIIQKVKPILEKKVNVLFSYLFGSSVHQAHATSDIDIAVFIEPNDTKMLFSVEKDLDVELAPTFPQRRVDLLIINVAPLVIQFKAITESEVIFSRNEQKRVDFETAVLCRYFDFKPYLDEEKRLIVEKLKRTG